MMKNGYYTLIAWDMHGITVTIIKNRHNDENKDVYISL